MKNPTSGSISIGVNSVVAAQHPHTAVLMAIRLKQRGILLHILCCAEANTANFHLDKLYKAQELLEKAAVQNPAVIIDASHENSRMNGKKDPEMQMDVRWEVLHNLRMHPELKKWSGFYGGKFPQKVGRKTSMNARLKP